MSRRKLTDEQLQERAEMSRECQAWLEKYMTLKGWGVNKTAEMSGVSKQNISRVKKGTKSKKQQTPPVFERETILRLAKAFNSSIREALAVIKQLPDDISSGDLAVQKGADLLAKLTPKRRDEAIDYLQHLVSSQDAKKAARKLEGEKAPRRTRKKANGNGQ